MGRWRTHSERFIVRSIEMWWEKWKTEQMTRSETRWGCFLPDLTRLARGTSIASLPPVHMSLVAC